LWGVWTYRTRRQTRRLVADLQVKQELKRVDVESKKDENPAPSPHGRNAQS
jgi:hypothetical protein